MKKILPLILCCLLFTAGCFSQVPPWTWAQKASSSRLPCAGYGITIDGSGNTYISGGFDDTLWIGADTITTNVGVNGHQDFVAKYDPAGNLKWVKYDGGIALSYGVSITSDMKDGIYVTGSFADSVTFDTITLKSHSQQDMFLVKYDTMGNALWAVSSQSTMGSAAGRSVGVDAASGNIYVAGYFNARTVAFGNDSLTGGPVGIDDIFIVKYDSVGNELWVRGAGGNHSAENANMAIEPSGNIYTSGFFSSTVFDIGGVILQNPDSVNTAYIAKYDGSGNVLWAKNAVGEIYPLPGDPAVATDSAGNVFMCSSFEGPEIDFDSIQVTHDSAVTRTFFVAKYSSAGQALWARSDTSTSSFGRCVSSAPYGGVYVVGGYNGDSISFANYSISYNSGGLFVVNYDANGNVIWAKGASGENTEGYSSVSDPAGNLYLTGLFIDSAQFDSTLLVGDGIASTLVCVTAKLGNATVVIPTNATDNLLPEIHLYPNPTNTNWQLSTGNNLIGSAFEVWDNKGQIIYQSKITSTVTQIGLPALASGIYFLRVNSSEGLLVKKLVKF